MEEIYLFVLSKRPRIRIGIRQDGKEDTSRTFRSWGGFWQWIMKQRKDGITIVLSECLRMAAFLSTNVLEPIKTP